MGEIKRLPERDYFMDAEEANTYGIVGSVL
ncbi:ATP-dependent Clp protease proteolytic subunit [Bacillus velezensis]|nr:ATP-dependent Clp protease proteolytic subunit [Bacillus velezensis]